MFNLLKGLRIIDLTTIVLGPYATQILADFGADIIKVESLEGDAFRAVRPARKPDRGVGFLNYNRNKRSVALDLKQPEAQAILHRLVADADVLVHNMRKRSTPGLGVDYETLSAINPKLVYCYSPGFGERGPDRDAPAYDDIIQARSGLASLNADSSGAPQFVRTIACDKVVGLHLGMAIVSGVLSQREQGKGLVIEVPMFETMTSFLLSEHLAGQTLIPPEGEPGYDRLMAAHRRPYRTADGYLAIMPYTTRQWVRFFTLCERPDWAEDEIVTDAGLRSDHIDDLYARVSEVAPQHTTERWLQLLAEADIPCSVVNSLTDLLTDPHLLASEMYHEIEESPVGAVRELRSPFQVDGKLSHHQGEHSVAPALGQHTRSVLTEIGYSDSDIEKLFSAGTVGGTD